jgi:hypothetical protein
MEDKDILDMTKPSKLTTQKNEIYFGVLIIVLIVAIMGVFSVLR